MKKVFAVFTIIICMVTLVFNLTGCSIKKETAGKSAVCFIVANTANSKGLNFNSPLVQDTVYTTIRNYGFISVVNADANPEVVFSKSFEIDEQLKKASRKRLDMDASSNSDSLIGGMKNLIADDPEIDYHKSLHEAVRMLTSLQGYQNKIIVMLGTGLSSTGVMNFQNNFLSAEPEVITDLLKDKSEIPDFTGITVYTQHLGDVAAPQKELNSAQRLKLEQIYSQFVEAGNGKFFADKILPLSADVSREYPPVSPVELPSDNPVVFEKSMLKDENALDKTIFLTEKNFAFVADKTEFIYPEKAEAILHPIADYLISNRDINILLVGTTAGDTDYDGSIRLSKQRADAVKNSLVRFGVDAQRITAIGLGSEKDPWHIPGGGLGDSLAAAQNRKVVLLNSSSEMAVRLIRDEAV